MNFGRKIVKASASVTAFAGIETDVAATELEFVLTNVKVTFAVAGFGFARATR